jgi:hypothetical integral membrane protein (TIGR02206 family)
MSHNNAEFAVISAMQEFKPFGPSHWAALTVFAIGAAALVWIGHRQTESQARLLGRTLATLAVVAFVADLIHKEFSSAGIADGLPLQLCDFASIVAAYALWSQRQWAFDLTYYWGLLLSTQALITPVIDGPDFPSLRYFTFWILHVLVVWAPIYLTWGRGMRPQWRSYRLALIATLAWAVFAITFNIAAGTNYGFLNRKPDTPTMLDVLGPWPVYLLTEISIVVVAWALMTWPWERKKTTKDADITRPAVDL